MAADEYSTGGGKLKLKGSKVSDGRVEKKKKKKKAAKKDEEKQSQSQSLRAEQEPDRSQEREQSREKTPLNGDESGPGAAKTETERKYEEVRRKRVCSLTLSILGFFLYCFTVEGGIVLIQFQLHERLQREGVKTHKERVEELNTYLSRLSEHHDMYASLSLSPLEVR